MVINGIVQYTGGFLPDIYCLPKPLFLYGPMALISYIITVRESRIFVETSKSRPTHARLRNRELADEAELVSLSVYYVFAEANGD